MRTKYIARLGGIAAVIAATLMWPVSASAQPRVFDPPGPGAVGAAAADRTAPAPASMTATAAGPGLTRQLAQARLATAKYATNLARAKHDGSPRPQRRSGCCKWPVCPRWIRCV